MLPRSLFARMALVMIAGLLVAQALSTLLLFDERSRWMLQGRIARSSHRIADAIRVLERQAPALRPAVAQGFATPEFELRVLAAAPRLPETETELASGARNLAGELEQQFPGQQLRVSAAFDTDAPPLRDRDGGIFETSIPATRILAAMASADGQHWYQARWHLPADSRGLPDRVFWEMGLRLVVLLLLLLVAVRWVTRPLSVLAQAADRLGRNLDEPPIAEHGPSEVRRAAQAFNRMQTRLRELVRQKAQMLTAVSHDLKTPITRLRLRAEMLDDGELRRKIGRDLDEMESMVAGTLDLMRGSHGSDALSRTDLLALVESLQADYEDMGAQVSVSAAPLPAIELRPQAMRRCLSNLIDNGLKYGTRVHLRVHDGEHAVRIEIDDEGPGIPEAELERVFEPFYRLEASRSRETGGSGMGLAIARAIASEHAGSLHLENRAGGGLRAVLVLPRR